jgi:polyisoprenoid-binding protein YceI
VAIVSKTGPTYHQLQLLNLGQLNLKTKATTLRQNKTIIKMKKSIRFASALILSASLLASCDSAPKGDAAHVSEKTEAKPAASAAMTLNVDVAASQVVFTGNGVGKNHPGKFNVDKGTIMVADGKVTGGKFNIAISSMKMSEAGEAIQTDLAGHLLGGDFFDSAKYPGSTFEITSVTPYTPVAGAASVVAGANYTVSGNLTLKDVTKNVSFPANIAVLGNTVTAKANFNIDRTVWGMSYGNDKSLGDKFISPEVNIELNLSAK